MKRIELLNTPLDVATMQETVRFIVDRIEKGLFTQHVVVNVAKLVNMRTDPVLFKSVRNSDLINVDGMGIVLGARFLGENIPERVSGIDLFYELLKVSSEKKFPVFLLGARPEVVDQARKNLLANYPDLLIAGAHHGYFKKCEEKIVQIIKESGAKLLFVAISSPKKEDFINHWKEELGVNFAMGVGGTFDVVAGVVKRAPVWMRKVGLEWLFRVVQEPRRLWKRYFVTNSKFFFMLIKEKFRR